MTDNALSLNADALTAAPIDIDVNGIMAMIPHRYPMLLLERIRILSVGERAIGFKNVSINEHFFTGHFPEKPVMPGVLIVEALAQTAGIVVVHSLGTKAQGKLVYFMGIDEAKFRKPVAPGDQIQLHVTKQHGRRNVFRFSGEAIVDGKVCAEAIFTAMIMDV
ncbi:MAG: 3-hydroxyacyl-ACP dehydratase FabZ [Holosporales bacterium]|jgi:3-hydroxyacyl-[acyl-carrier-protein] dehydratase